MHNPSILSLGDSYTIGEAVELRNNFPYQVIQRLRRSGLQFRAPEILAKTGWTTDELDAAIRDYSFLPQYDFVTLLIGVNNQYRGREVMEYKTHFEDLLKLSIGYAAGGREHVIVLSIPDYSVTPFAAAMETEKIRKEIDVFNSVNRAVSVQYKVNYLDITPGSREAASDDSLLAADKLHPSEKEYSRWAEMVFEIIAARMKK